jgi:hypothetical protein
MSLALLSARALPAMMIDFSNTDPSPKSATPPEAKRVKPKPLPSTLKSDRILSKAYYDTIGVLNTPGPCSDFFGGSGTAMQVLDELVSHVKRDYVAPSVGMHMGGDYINVLDASTQKSYRLFDKVSINGNGPFYKQKFGNASQTVPGVGSFRPNSREVRVLILLHELAHLIKGADGKWLVPDDGKDDDISRANSQKIEDLCGSEIRGLSTTRRDLAKHKEAQESLSEAGAATGNQQ